MRKIYLLFLMVMLSCIGCEWHLRPKETDEQKQIAVQRYDHIEALYLTTGDVAALHQMNTDYPLQTQLLIENLLQLGHVNDSDINTRLLVLFQDTTLQTLIQDIGKQYADMSDINKQLTTAFQHLQKLMPHLSAPHFYAQIGSLDQSIVVDNGVLGISLDKYLGKDYPAYLKYGYSEHQRQTMTRSYIVPDCLSFYLLSMYPLSEGHLQDKERRAVHMGRIQYVVNLALGYEHFQNDHVKKTKLLMEQNPSITLTQLLEKGAENELRF